MVKARRYVGTFIHSRIVMYFFEYKFVNVTTGIKFDYK